MPLRSPRSRNFIRRTKKVKHHMSSAAERFEDRSSEDSAQRMARRLDRDLRLRAQRRRSALFALSLAVTGTVLLIAGLSAAMARDDRRADSIPSERISQPAVVEPSVSSQETSVPATATAAAKSPDAVVAPSPAPSPAKDPVQKAPAKPAATPAPKSTKKATTARASDSEVLIRKCAGSGCHSQSEVSGGGLDVGSAQSAVQAMIDGGHVKLTSAERAAIIAALTR